VTRSWQFPIPNDWDGESWICRELWVPDSVQWRALVRGAVYELTRGRAYDASTGSIAGVQIVAKEIFERFLSSGPCTPCGEHEPGDCQEFLPVSPNVTYWPNHPTLQPNYFYPWPFPFLGTRWHDDAGLLSELLGEVVGILPDDVWQTYALPWPTDEPGEPAELDLPSCTFWFSGEGVVEVHYLTMANGGYGLVTIDGNPLSLQVINFNLDWLGEIEQGIAVVEELVEEFEISGSGPHSLKIEFALWPTTSFPWLRFGGGIRKFVLCGEDMEGVVPMPEMKIDECRLWVRWEGGSWLEVDGEYDLCADSIALRTPTENPCKIEISYDGGTEWETLFEIAGCMTPHEQTLVRQNADSPCKLEASYDGGTEWETFAELNLCGEFDPPEPPPETSDAPCAFAVAAAAQVADIVLEIAEWWASQPAPRGFYQFSAWVVHVWLTYPGVFKQNRSLQMFIAMLAHIGAGGDLAPIINADYDDCTGELACGAYCSLEEDANGLIKVKQLDWGGAHYDESDELVLFDGARSGGRELLDVVSWWLYIEAFDEEFWSLLQATWSIQEDTEFDCASCDCEHSGTAGDTLVYPDVPECWLGVVDAVWGGTESGGLLITDDYHAPAFPSNDQRRTCDMRLPVPYGNVSSIAVEYTIEAGTTPPSDILRLYWTPRGGSETQLLSTGAWSGDGTFIALYDTTELEDISQIRLFLDVDHKTSAGALTGSGSINAVSLIYADGSQYVDDPDDLEIDYVASPGASITRRWAQIYKVAPAYQETGGDEWYAAWIRNGAGCFNHRAVRANNTMSQSVRVACGTLVENVCAFGTGACNGYDLFELRSRKADSTAFVFLAYAV